MRHACLNSLYFSSLCHMKIIGRLVLLNYKFFINFLGVRIVNKELPSFERLHEMAIKDPDGLERLRQEYVEAAINIAPEAYRRRLKGLQFQIDGQRQVSTNSLSACINISKMMHESLYQLRDLINSQDEVTEPQQKDKAVVLSFPNPMFS
jgi:hypothetical protein